MVEERRSSLSYSMGGSFEAGQTNNEKKHQELDEIRVQLDALQIKQCMTTGLLKEKEDEIQDLSNQLVEVKRLNEEHEALSRILLFILSYVSSVELTTLILEQARYIGVDPDSAFVALERLYGDVATKATPHIIEIIKQGFIDDAIKSDLYNKVLDLKT